MKTSNPLIFTPGPVKEFPEIINVAAAQTPYFRNQKFSDLMLDNQAMLLDLVNAPDGSKVVILTASGTAAMEAAVINLVAPTQKVVSVVSGGFGERFSQICNVHQRHCDSHRPDFNEDLSDSSGLLPYKAHDALLINGHETTICHHFNLESVGKFCHQHDLLNIVDGISMFLTDQLDMTSQYIDALLISSQKGLALPPGLAMAILTPRAISRLQPNPATLYFNFNDYLSNGERGQTPYTPAVSLIIQLNARLLQLKTDGGLSTSISKTAAVAQYFREHIQSLPLALYSTHMPNSVTALSITNGLSASQLVSDFEQRYNMILCPNGGDLAERVFRVSHMGNVTIEDTQQLITSLYDYFGITQ